MIPVSVVPRRSTAKRILVGLIVVLGGWLVATAQQAVPLGVSTLGIDLEVAPGESQTGTFTVVNRGEEPIDVEVALRDFTRALDGGLRLLDPETHARSLAPYLSYAPTELTLGAGESRPVSYRVELPEGASGPHWSMLMVRERSERNDDPNDEDERQAGGVLSFSFGVQLRQVDPSHRVLEGRLTNTEVVPPQDGAPRQVVTTFENTGTAFPLVSGEIRIIDADGREVTTVEVSRFRVFPNLERQVTTPIDADLSAGTFLALVVLDFGGDYKVGGQTRFRVP